MTIRTSVARAGSSVRNALSFAHLSGIGATKAADDEEDKKKKDAEDKEKDKDARAEDDKDEQDRSDGDSKAADDKDDERAEDKDDDKEASEDDEDDDGKEKKKATEDDDEEEMHGKGALAKARRRERARCAAIFGDKASARNMVLAAHLAFNTALTRKEAIEVLRGTPAAAAPSTAARAASNPRLGPGGTPALTGKQAIAASWDQAFAKADMRKRK